jgi:probable HAF family extracellular repeat protein
MIDLDTLGSLGSTARDVNAAGQVVGYMYTQTFTYHAFSWTANGGMIDLGEGFAGRVNSRGQIVGYSAGVQATMWVTVDSLLNTLIDQVVVYGLPHGPTNAFTAKLQVALASWQRGRTNAAVHQIGAFIHQVSAKQDKALSAAQADRLIRMAEDVIVAINGSPR